MRLFSVSVSFVSVLLSASLGHATQGFYFLSSSSVNLATFPAPPAEGSAEDIKDLDGVRAYQRTRTQADCNRASSEAGASLDSFYGAPYGPLNEAEISKVQSLYLDVFNDTDFFVSILKAKWRRPRPYVRDPNIKLCIPSHPAASYPSGHAAMARIGALMLSKLYPTKTADLLKRGDLIGLDRVIGGVHHPLDIEEGKHLGDLVFEALLNSAEFNKRLRLIRRER